MASSRVNANAALLGVLDDTTDVSDISSEEEEEVCSDVEAMSDISFASSEDEESESDEPAPQPQPAARGRGRPGRPNVHPYQPPQPAARGRRGRPQTQRAAPPTQPPPAGQPQMALSGRRMFHVAEEELLQQMF